MQYTGQQIITQAVTALNIIDDGGSISASESAGLLVELNNMIESLMLEEAFVPSVLTAQYQLTAALNPYPIGPGATAPFNVARPVRIDSAFQVSTVGTGTTRKPLRIVGSVEYFRHGDLKAAATTADELYPDWQEGAGGATGIMNLYLFPVPACPTVTFLELQTWNVLLAMTLGGSVNLPPGYADFLVQGLAFRCISRYGAVINPAVAQTVTATGKAVADRIRKLNVQNRLLDPSLAPPTEAQQAALQAGQQPQQRQQ